MFDTFCFLLLKILYRVWQPAMLQGLARFQPITANSNDEGLVASLLIHLVSLDYCYS